MPLSTAQTKLRQDIKAALEAAVKAGQEDGDVSQQVINTLSAELASSIHAYVTSAAVDISSVISTVAPGIPVATAGTATAQVGASVSPGKSTHAGFGTLK